MHGVEGTEIVKEAEEIREIRGTGETAEEDGIIEMADGIGMVREMGGMEEGIEEIVVSTMKIELCWFFGVDLMRNKRSAETQETTPANGLDLEITRDDEAEVHQKSGNAHRKLAMEKSPRLTPNQRRSSRKVEHLRRQ